MEISKKILDASQRPDTPGSMPATAKAPDIASASVPDTLAALHVNPETGLTHAEVDARRKEHGYNEVAEQRGHPFLMDGLASCCRRSGCWR